MKGLLGGLLALALLVGAAHSLKCYTCDAELTTAACNTPTTCPAGSQYCMKVVASVTGVSAVSKSCAPDCTEGSVSAQGSSGSVFCCKSDLCNGASSARMSYTLLSLAAGISALLVKGAL
ncbi:hypothetical protein NDU88_005088 [Pleurodeles waltl]|uniref:UPAR/Ly6 domain-containing protein n=1 Tax=Pleurodeles waltl TaxID=8319 RepID=A0AAV7V322_PLEWA|nr:hypothetical protein NDU88_005088 [Pleurodeles waltl]